MTPGRAGLPREKAPVRFIRPGTVRIGTTTSDAGLYDASGVAIGLGGRTATAAMARAS